ncbi:hypothetical protein Q4583_01010 [Neptunomonas phycophila]|uniref:hypothetical protein n=1 Tax=Neptunomonas phycophila TaxID=1572645 RepID=UPI0026E22655|nr:hypothetical protein [Neptunomonas phycophila]MDO6782675.1 hypothetical protein [Neptunomonas phycophila]
MSNYDLSVRVFTNGVVYDVILNGVPVIKNRNYTNRSLNIPTMGYLKEGSNNIIFNYSVVRSEDGKIVHVPNEETYFYLGLENDKDPGAVLSIIEGKFNKSKKEMEIVEGYFPGGADNNKTKSLEKYNTIQSEYKFKLGNRTIESQKFSIDIKSQSGMKEDLFDKGELISIHDKNGIRDAYVKYHGYLESENFDDFILTLRPFYKKLSYINDVDDYIDFIDLKNDLSVVDDEGYKLAPLKIPDIITDDNVEILADGYLVRLLPSPIRWSKDGRFKQLSLIFKKVDDEFVPALISDDFNF